MTLKELKKLIEDEVAAAAASSTNEINEPLREPQISRPRRPVYKPVLKTEDEIDIALFHGGKKPEDA